MNFESKSRQIRASHDLLFPEVPEAEMSEPGPKDPREFKDPKSERLADAEWCRKRSSRSSS